MQEMTKPCLANCQSAKSSWSVGDLPRMLWNMLGQWYEREQQRHHLRDIEAHLLKDVGLSREEIRREIEKPFWRR